MFESYIFFYFQISESRFIAFVRKKIGITKSHKQEDGAMCL